MRVAVYLAIVSLFISCGSDVEVENTDKLMDVQDTDTTQSGDIEEITEFELDVSFPTRISDDPCLPYPNDEFLYYLERDSTYVFSGNEYNVLFNYLVAHFDSLTPRVHHEVKDEYDMGTYHWEQNFTNGLSFEEFFGGEGGATATLYTSCTDEIAIFSTLNTLINYPRLLPNGEYVIDGFWEDDSTEFGPESGAGCFYSILKNDSTGYYFIENYCGC